MKTLITAIALATLATSAVADPTARRTLNSGKELYSNRLALQATEETDCVLPWVAANHVTLGTNGQRLVYFGDIGHFYDCKPLPPKAVVIEKTVATEVVKETTVEKKVEVAPAPMPATVEPVVQPKKLRE